MMKKVKTMKVKKRVESDTNDLSEGSDDEPVVASSSKFNPGWADSISKILKTNKPKKKKVLVLSKAKKLSDVKPKEEPQKLSFEIDGEVKVSDSEAGETTIKEDVDKQSVTQKRRKKRSIPSYRVKPTVLNLNRERQLRKIATKGVVQLFNAVRDQQKDITAKLEEAGPLESRKDKLLKKIDKRSFLDVLMGEKSVHVDEDDGDALVEIKKLKKDEEKPHLSAPAQQSSWKVLQDDFMLSNKLKDWDKNVSSEEESVAGAEESEDDSD